MKPLSSDRGEFNKNINAMYLGKRKIYDPKQHEADRAEVIKSKDGAIWNAFTELEGLINISQLTEQYFEKSRAWFSQKLHGNEVCDKKRGFTEAECAKLAESFRHIAMRLNAHADEIDAARMDDEKE